MSLEIIREFEDRDPALLDGHLDGCLKSAPDTLTLAAHEERAEAGKFHGLAGSPRCQEMHLMADFGG